MHMVAADIRDYVYQNPNDDELALKLYFWDEDEVHVVQGCCDCCKSKKNEADESSVMHSTLKCVVSMGAAAAARQFEEQLQGLAGGDVDADKTVQTKTGVRFSRMFTTTMRGTSGSCVFEAHFGWTQWSFCEKVCHAVRKYNAIFAALRPSLQFSCRQKVVFLWAAFSGSMFSQTIFFAGHGSASKCAERRAQLNDLEKMRLSIAVGLVSTLISATALNIIKGLMRKQAVWSKGWTEDKKRSTLRRWRFKNRTMLCFLMAYIVFAFFYLFCFMLVRQPNVLLTAMAAELITNLIVIPTVVAIIVAHILTEATKSRKDGSDDPTAYHRWLRQSPGLCDFSHEHHKSIGHFGRRQLKTQLRLQSTTAVAGNGAQGDSMNEQETSAERDADVTVAPEKESHQQHQDQIPSTDEPSPDIESGENPQTDEAAMPSSSSGFFQESAKDHEDGEHGKCEHHKYLLTVKCQTRLNGIELRSLSPNDKQTLRDYVGAALAEEANVSAEDVRVELSAGSVILDAEIDHRMEGKQKSALLISSITKKMKAPDVKTKVLEAAMKVSCIADTAAAGHPVYLEPIEVEVEAHRVKPQQVQKHGKESDETNANIKLSKSDKVIWPCCSSQDVHSSVIDRDGKTPTESTVKEGGVNLHFKCCNVDRFAWNVHQ
eukprot:gnl/MRDRNA2_/MRDRNA2_179321_c0_seq1.p1 gnl/MRDRNA2_/MRDRNA2_179321_c0~~gnl/MRDRNA2_/MRDRNA2_179321_c0_seq1.p1  ORF type:complete len:657 (+),score=110.19 gnl/MRDRNA2_/MRDRNA2_179321_c0_seq1:1-1971(+)